MNEYKALSFIVFKFLMAILAVLFVVQSTTLESVKSVLITDSSAAAYSLSIPQKAGLILESLTPFDLVLLALLCLSIIWFLAAGLKQGRIYNEMSAILQSDRLTLLLLGLLGVISVRFYLSPGVLFLGDSCLHTYRAWGAARSLATNRLPYWSFFNYCGYPFLQFYGPLFYIITAIFSPLIGSLSLSIKFWLFLFHVASGFAIYFWTRTVGLDRGGSLIAALAFILTFQHTHTVVWTGALPASAIFFFFPLLLLCVEKIFTGGRNLWIPLSAIITSAMVLSHQGYAVYGLQLLVFYVIMRMFIPAGEGDNLKSGFVVFAGISAGILICSIFLWPILFDRGAVYYPEELPILRPGLPGFDFFQKVLMWRNTWSGWTLAYAGISFIALAIIGAFRVLGKCRERACMISRAVAIASLFALLCSARSGRVFNLALPFLAVLAGMAAGIGVEKKSGLILVILLVLGIDLGPTTIQSPFRKDMQFISRVLHEVAERTYPHRIIYGYRSKVGIHFFNWADGRMSEVSIPTGFFPQGAPRSLNGLTAMVDYLNSSQPEITEDAKTLLYLWDVAGLLTYTREKFVKPSLSGLMTDTNTPPLARVDAVSPAVFSRNLVLALDDTLLRIQKVPMILEYGENDAPRKKFLEHMREWIRSMRVNRKSAVSHIILIDPISANTIYEEWNMDKAEISTCVWPPGKQGLKQEVKFRESRRGSIEGLEKNKEGVLEIKEYKVDMYHVLIKYYAHESGYLRLAFSWYPSLKVVMDGLEVVPARSLFGAIVIPTEDGEHVVELVPAREIGVLSIIFTLAGIVLVIMLTVFRRSY